MYLRYSQNVSDVMLNFFTEIITHLSVKVLSELGQVVIVSPIKVTVTGLVLWCLKDVLLLIQPPFRKALGPRNICNATSKTVRSYAFDSALNIINVRIGKFPFSKLYIKLKL